MKKAHTNKKISYIHQYEEIEEKLYPTSFSYVWTSFEHQIQDKHATQRIQVFPVFADQEHNSGTSRVNIEQVPYQALLIYCITQILQYSE